MNPLKSIVINLLIPSIISLLFVIVIWYTQEIPKAIFSLVPYLFYAISILVLWVSWHFNRNKFIFIMIPLICMHLGFDYFSAANATQLFMLSSLLIPVHFLVFLVLKERGLFSIWGISKIGFFVFEIALIAYLIYFPSDIVQSIINLKIFAISFYPLKDIAVVIGITVVFIFIALVLFNKYLLYNSSFLVIVISFYGGLYFLKTPYATDISLLAISVIIDRKSVV